MSLFVPLDVDYQTDPKIIAAGYIGECLYNRALALAKRTKNDGVIARVQLPGLCLGIPGKPTTHAQSLVKAGLWREHADGWFIAAWLKRNQSAGEINDKVARKKAAALAANHQRWHVETGKTSPTCPLCHPTGVRTGSDTESIEEETEEEVEEEPQQQQSDGSGIEARAAAAIDIAITHRCSLPGVKTVTGLTAHLRRILPATALAYAAQHPTADAATIAWNALDGPAPALRLLPAPESEPCTHPECSGGHLPSDPDNADPARHKTAIDCPECSPSAGVSVQAEAR